jgi:hypothetical protein
MIMAWILLFPLAKTALRQILAKVMLRWRRVIMV